MYEVMYDPQIEMEDLDTGEKYVGVTSEWVEYLAKSGRDIMQNLQITGNDLTGVDCFSLRYIRRFWFRDASGRTYDPRMWSDEIEKYRKKWHQEQYHRPACNGIFRCEPVPKTGKRRFSKRWRNPCRKIRVMNECRQGLDPEVAELIRPERRTHRLLIMRRFSDYRETERSWKTQRKTRHQWKVRPG